MDKHDQTQPDEPSTRQQANRLGGLSSYAMGILLLGLIGFFIYDDPGCLKKDFKTIALFGLAALVCFAIGYTTSVKKK